MYAILHSALLQSLMLRGVSVEYDSRDPCSCGAEEATLGRKSGDAKIVDTYLISTRSDMCTCMYAYIRIRPNEESTPKWQDTLSMGREAEMRITYRRKRKVIFEAVTICRIMLFGHLRANSW